MTYETHPMGGRLGVSGTLVYHDKDGNVLKTVELSGSIPLTQEQAEQLKEEADGADDCK